MRLECFRCAKPERLCLCARIPTVRNRTHVVVVQHPRERGHAIGTSRFVELGLASSEVFVAHELDVARTLRALEGRRAVLLHPSRTSVSIDALAEPPDTLVVVDGTWPMAKTLVRKNPDLAALPHVHLSPTAPSRYRIRKEPSFECLSTLEATLLALTSLEPDLDGTETLLSSFDAMIDDQIATHSEEQGGDRRRRKKKRAYVGVPAALGERFADLVLVYAEMSLRRADKSRVLLRWSAVRLRDGAIFDAFVRPRGNGLPALVPEGAPELHASEDGEELAAAASRFRSFVGPDAVVGAWNGALVTRATTFVGANDTLDLGAAYRAMRGTGVGVLDRVVVHERCEIPELALTGRAGPRLANAVALAFHLHREAKERGASERAR